MWMDRSGRHAYRNADRSACARRTSSPEILDLKQRVYHFENLKIEKDVLILQKSKKTIEVQFYLLECYFSETRPADVRKERFTADWSIQHGFKFFYDLL